MKLVILGAPGAGKGTQAVNLAKHYNINHVSTGDLLREQMYLGTEIGDKVGSLLEKGKFAPDDIVIKLLKNHLDTNLTLNGYVLDGFPRNLEQAKALETIAGAIDKVIEVQVKDEVIIKRMAGRLVCPNCKLVFNRDSRPPKEKGICDSCNTKLIQRDDDKPNAVAERLRIYHDVTEPVIDFYKERNLLLEVAGLGDVSDITLKIVKSLGEN